MAENETPFSDSLFPNEPLEAPAVKRPRGRPRKHPLPTPAPVTVPRDQPSEWTIPRPGEEVAPVTNNQETMARATVVQPLDENTVFHASNEIQADEIQARREAARAFVDDIGRLKTDMKTVDSYIVTPPAAAVEPPDESSDEDVLDRPLSRNDYLLQRRPQKGNKRGDRFTQNNYNNNRKQAQGGNTPEGESAPLGRHGNNRQDRQNNGRGARQQQQSQHANNHRPREAQERAPEMTPEFPAVLRMSEVEALNQAELFAMAESMGILDSFPSHSHSEMVFLILRAQASQGGAVVAEGHLEIGADGHGYLRQAINQFLTSSEDAMVPQQLLRRYGLRPGDFVEGSTRPPSRDQRERRFVVTEVTQVNGVNPLEARQVALFDAMEATYPTRQLRLETDSDAVEMRLMDMVCPMGFGTRGVLVTPRRMGKSILLKKMATAILRNYPEADVNVVLVDERPEEVTEMKRGNPATVYATGFDQPPERHIQMVEMVLDIAQRKAERGQDVVVLIDSLTRLNRAYQSAMQNANRTDAGDVNVMSLVKTKRCLSTARALEGGGSVTILGTVINEREAGQEALLSACREVCTMHMVLDREVAVRNVFPALHLLQSETHEIARFVPSATIAKMNLLRQSLVDMPLPEATELLISLLKGAESNAAFFEEFEGKLGMGIAFKEGADQP